MSAPPGTGVAAPAGVLVGVDVGGSKTALRIVDAATTAVLVDTSVATPPWRGVGWAQKAAVLAGLLRTHGVGEETGVLAVGVGAHGCDTTTECLALQDALQQRLSAAVRVVNDGQLLGVAAGHPEAIGLVCGTGSIAVGTTADGNTVHAGGAGWLLGDDGGATGLVREAVRAALIARDAGHEDRVLSSALLGASGNGSLSQLGMAMMVQPPQQWAGHAPAVFAADVAGSRLARTVLAAAADSMVSIILSVLRQGATSSHVVIGGSVALAQPEYVQQFRARLSITAPQLEVTVLRSAPVTGAVHLAHSVVVAAPTPAPNPAPDPGLETVPH